MPVTNYVWDPVTDSCLMETDETGATKATYTVEPEPFGKVVSQRRDGETTYYHYDGLGSTRELTDDSQAIVNTNLYDAWGVNRKRTGDVENPFQYVGERGYQFDEETLGTYVRARVCSSFIARWQSEDWSARTDPRKYLYVENRPTIFIDPSGLETFSGEWSRGGDDEERTYETARIHIDVTTAKECDNACGCGGHVKYGLHYHAKVGGSRSIGPASPGRNYRLCLVLPDGSRSWTKFTLQSRFPDRTGPDGNGYRYWYELLANVDLGLLQCAGEV